MVMLSQKSQVNPAAELCLCSVELQFPVETYLALIVHRLSRSLEIVIEVAD